MSTDPHRLDALRVRLEHQQAKLTGSRGRRKPQQKKEDEAAMVARAVQNAKQYLQKSGLSPAPPDITIIIEMSRPCDHDAFIRMYTHGLRVLPHALN